MSKKKKLPLTEKQLLAMIVTDLRKRWQATKRKEFIDKVRMQNRDADAYRFKVRCVNPNCFKSFGQSQKEKVVLANGTWSKKEKLCYSVDHVEGITPLKTIKDLSAFVQDLFYGPMQILCYKCHKEKTKRERA